MQRFEQAWRAIQGLPNRPSSETYGFLLTSPLDTPEKIRCIAGLSIEPPLMRSATPYGEDQHFVRIKSEAKDMITEWLAQATEKVEPTFWLLSKARKEVDEEGGMPRLGLGKGEWSRSSSQEWEIVDGEGELRKKEVKQDEFPVWYFVYGVLSARKTLKGVLGMDPEEVLECRAASVHGGVLKTCRDRRQVAMVDGNPQDVVRGVALEIKNKAQEDSLCFSMTADFEVVGCDVLFNDSADVGRMRGYTFRFVGEKGGLSESVRTDYGTDAVKKVAPMMTGKGNMKKKF
ncbi:MAG: hypothetical protein M1820_002362 [Bogoriella megaspora]|nr:MAG: hypothetical protein M1820_002362 [Bogoriella megaspora]